MSTNWFKKQYKFFTLCLQVALLDVDICGPSIPRIMGLEGEQVSCVSQSSSNMNISFDIYISIDLI